MSSVDIVGMLRDQVAPAMLDALSDIGGVALGIAAGILVLPRAWRLFKRLSDDMLDSGSIAGWSEHSEDLGKRQRAEARADAEQAKWDAMRKRLGS